MLDGHALADADVSGPSRGYRHVGIARTQDLYVENGDPVLRVDLNGPLLFGANLELLVRIGNTDQQPVAGQVLELRGGSRITSHFAYVEGAKV